MLMSAPWSPRNDYRCAAALLLHRTRCVLPERWQEAANRIDDPAALARTIEELATWTFAFIQALTRGIVERYSSERERWAMPEPGPALEVEGLSGSGIPGRLRD
jgi:hypothetical protein